MVGGIAFRVFAPRFRKEANGLLGLAAAELLIPAAIFGLAALGYWIHPPQPTSDALGPSPVWHMIYAIPISLILMAIAIIIMLKITVQAALGGVRSVETKMEDNNQMQNIGTNAPNSDL